MTCTVFVEQFMVWRKKFSGRYPGPENGDKSSPERSLTAQHVSGKPCRASGIQTVSALTQSARDGVHAVHENLDMFGRCELVDAMPEVENMPT